MRPGALALVHVRTGHHVRASEGQRDVSEQPLGLEWAEVTQRLHGERTLWLSTVRPDGAPHAAPVWLAVWEGDAFIFTSGSSVKASNLRSNPQALLHTCDGEDVLIVTGQLMQVGHPREFHDVMTAFAKKYREPGDAEFLPDQDATADTLFRFVPAKAMAWNLGQYEESQRRWTASTHSFGVRTSSSHD